MQGNDFQSYVRQLIDRQAESRSLDYKAARAFGPSRAEKGEILKCIMAFANTRDGGNILIGVEEAAGRFVAKGVTATQAKSFDPSDIGNSSQNFCSVRPAVSVHVVAVDGVDIILLRVSEFEDEPVVCIKDLHDKTGKSFVLQAGSIYVRTADAKCSAIDSGEAMRALLNLAVQKRGDTLLHQIRRLVGAPEVAEANIIPKAFTEEIEDAASLFASEELVEPYWCVQILPTTYEPERIDSNRRLREIRGESAVSVRGWDFPHIDREHDKAFERGIESVTHWFRYHEAHRLYKSGLFVWRRRLGEDFTDGYRGKLSYVAAIYSLTEFMIFASRFAPQVDSDGTFDIRIELNGLKDRDLHEDSGLFMEDYSTGARRFEQAYVLPVEEIRASNLDLAAKSARRLFDLYNLDISLETIQGWQKKLLEG